MDWRADIVQIIDRLRPATVLAIIPPHEPLRTELTQRPETNCRFVSVAELSSENLSFARSRLGIIVGVIEQLTKPEAGQVIARLRDLYAEVIYAAVPIGDAWPQSVSHWTNEELIAYGLRQARHYTVDGRPLILYHYDIYDYKLTPDWLNNRYWANPERWGKKRW